MIIPFRSRSEPGPAALAFVLAAALLVILAITAPAMAPLGDPSAALSALLLVAALAIATSASVFLGRGVAERLVILYIFLTPFQFQVFGGSLFAQGDEDFGLRVSLSDLILPLLLLVLLQKRIDHGSVLRSRSGLLLVALVVAVTASWGQSVFHLGSITRFATGKYIGLISLIVLAAALVEVIRERSLWERALDTLVLSGVAAGIIGIVGWLLWWLGGVSTYLMDFDRLNSTMFGDPNIFASLMAVTLILVIVRIRLSSPSSRWFWLGCAGIALLALVLTQSRSGYLGAAAGLAVLALWARPSATLAAVTTLILIGVVGSAAYVSIGSPGGASVASNQRLSGETLTSRLELWERGASLLPKEAITGIGIGSFEQTTFFEGTERLRSGFARAHNTYLTMLVEFGMAGVAAFALLGAGVIRAVRQGGHRLEGADQWRLAGIVSALIAMLVFAIGVDALYQRHLWILIGLALASPFIVAATRSPVDSEDDQLSNGDHQ